MTDAESWSRTEAEPTNLIVLWPGDAEPDEASVCAALDAAAPGAKRLGSADPEDPDMLWMAGFQLPTLPRPATVWAEPAQPIGAGELDDPAASACRWAIGLETVLDEHDPLGGYAALLKAIGTAWPGAAGVLDVNTTIWHPRRALHAVFVTSPAEPPADVLWTIHGVEHEASSTVWLHTHGLWRCGRPELEMIRVPVARVDAAAVLLNELAGLLLEEEVPWLDEPWEVGHGLHVTLHAWESVAETLDDDEPGSVADREDPDPDAHSGFRVAIDGIEPVLDALVAGSGLLYRTARATQRQATLARETWDEMVRAQLALKGVPETTTLVQAATSSEATPEHSWYEVETIDGDVIMGRLLNDPTTGDARRGDTCRVDRADVSDWQVITPAGSFDPDSVDEMAVAVGRLTDDGSS